MYEEFFRLSDAPFRLNPDPRFFFGSRSHNKAMAYLHYGLKQAEGFIVITGPVGAGKSMVIGHLIDQLNTSNVIAANLLTSNIEPQDLIGQILSAFRIEPEGEGRTGEIEAFEDYLFDQLNRGRRVLLIIDEAQNLPFKTLEELRMLSNIDYEGTPLFQVFLVGQPEFRTIIESENMEQLRQRVIASYHLENLSQEETREYILHRLSVAGWRDDPAFTDEAFHAIYEETTGLPRRINTLCNRLMLYCSLEQTHQVTAEIVESVCVELREEKLNARKTVEAMPMVSKVDDAARPEEDGDKAMKENSTPEHETQAKIKSAETATKPQPEPARAANDQPSLSPVVSSSMSVLDRLRAKKSDVDIGRHEATLNEVASAIAAASGSTTSDELPKDTDIALEKDSILQKVGDEDTPQWRKALIRSIDETREELKQANASAGHLSRSVSTGAASRKERRQKISDTLSRAEALLNELRQAHS